MPPFLKKCCLWLVVIGLHQTTYSQIHLPDSIFQIENFIHQDSTKLKSKYQGLHKDLNKKVHSSLIDSNAKIPNFDFNKPDSNFFRNQWKNKQIELENKKEALKAQFQRPQIDLKTTAKDSLLKLKIDSIRSLRVQNSTLDSLGQARLDSSVRSELKILDPRPLLKEYLLGAVPQNELPTIKQDTNGSTIRKLASQVKEKSKLDAGINMEFAHSNRRLPYQLSEQSYMRVDGNVGVSIGTLPFRADFYYTTEENSFYNSNRLTFSFDPIKFKEQSLERIQGKAKNVSSKINDIDRSQELISVYQNDLKREFVAKKAKYESSLSDLDNKLAEYEKFDSLSRIPNPEDYKSEIEASNYKDSLLTEILVQQQRVERFKKSLEILDTYLDKTEQAKSKIKEKEKLLIVTKRKYQRLIDLQKVNPESIGKKKFLKILNQVEHLQLGQSNPFFSQNTINAIPVNGVLLGIQGEKTFVEVVGGKTIGDYTFDLNQNEQGSQFTRRVAGAKFGFGELFGNNLSFTSIRYWDQINHSDQSTSKLNWVNGVQLNQFVLNRFQINAEVAHAIYSDDRKIAAPATDISIVPNSLPFTPKISDQMAYNLKVSGKLISSSILDISLDQKNYGFRSLGSPFHRTDYRMVDARLSQFFFNRKLMISGFYKSFIDNLSGYHQGTNTMNGLGFSSNLSLKNGFQASLLHLPFEQGNNHQDTLLRTNNKFKTTIGNLSYTLSKQRFSLRSRLSLTKSEIEYLERGGEKSNTIITSLTEEYHSEKFILGATLTRSLTNPQIDTLSFHAIALNCNYRIQKTLLKSTSQFKKTFSNGMFFSSGIALSRHVKDRVRIELNSTANYYDGLWGFNDFWRVGTTFRIELKI